MGRHRGRQRYRSTGRHDGIESVALKTDVLTLGLLAGAAYLIYRYVAGGVSAATTAVTGAASATSSGIADLAETLFPHTSSILVPGASIVLSTGEEIPTSAALGQGSFTAADGSTQIQFLYNGKVYRTSALPDDTNTYYAA